METSKTYVFFGIVGAGKGTQIELLKKLLSDKDGKKIVYAYPGAEYRTISVFGKILIDQMTDDCHVIADGYPRTLEQADAFEAAMEFYGRKDVEVVYIEVSKDEVTRRMKLRNRSDDTDEGITRRFYEYETHVIPSMKALEGKGYKFHTVNGEQSVEAVHSDIVKALGL